MQIDEAYEKYFGVIYKTCMLYLKNPADAEDAVSETFLKLIRQKEPFESEEHLRRWLFVTAKNDCKNRLSHWWRKCRADSEVLETAESESEYGETLYLLLELPVKYREAMTFVYNTGLQRRRGGKDALGLREHAVYPAQTRAGASETRNRILKGEKVENKFSTQRV